MDLEKIIYNEDSGSAAIQKLDRNQRKIGNKVATINVEGLQQQINVLEGGKLGKTEKSVGTQFLSDTKNPDEEVIAGLTLNATQKGDDIPSIHPTIHWHNYITFGISNRLAQLAIQCYHGNPTLSFRSRHDDRFSKWHEVATTAKIELSSNLLNGWSPVGGFQKPYAVKVGNIVSISCRIKGGSTSLPCNLLQLPTELRPSLPVKGFANNDLKFAEINVNPDGIINCVGVNGGAMTNGSFTINMTYVI